jgi:response regulator RpfG family c-di-GMP phosphodiesterase
MVALACGFTEYLLKRKEKNPLSKETILDLMKERAGVKYDPIIMEEFLKDLENPKVRKKISDELEETNDNLLFEFAGDMFKPDFG